jgi:hypothetical protein
MRDTKRPGLGATPNNPGLNSNDDNRNIVSRPNILQRARIIRNVAIIAMQHAGRRAT